MRIAPLEAAETNEIDNHLNALWSLATGKFQHFEREGYVLVDCAPRQEHCVLKNEPDLMALTCDIDRFTVDFKGTEARLGQTGDNSQDGRLAAARRSYQANEFLIAD